MSEKFSSVFRYLHGNLSSGTRLCANLDIRLLKRQETCEYVGRLFVIVLTPLQCLYPVLAGIILRGNLKL